MTRIPPADLASLKASADLAGIIGEVVPLTAKGPDLVGRCPFHEDDTPSLRVTPSKGLWRCFGCDAGGDVVAFVMKHHGLNFRDAVKWLQRHRPTSTVPTTTAPARSTTVDPATLERAAAFYEAALSSSDEALAFLQKRCIPLDVAKRFRVGVANRTLGPSSSSSEREALASSGLIRSTGHEHFNGCLTVPLVDEAGAVVGMYGRKLQRASQPRHLYLPGVRRGFFNPAALSSSSVVLCEAIIDALSFIAAGQAAATCCYGVQGFSAELLQAFVRHGVKHVHIAFDADDAGDAAAVEVAVGLKAAGIASSRVLFPVGHDANDVWTRAMSPADLLSLLEAPAPVVVDRTPQPHPLAAAPAPALAPASMASPDAPTEPGNDLGDELPPPFHLDGDDVVFAIAGHRYVVRGFHANTSPLTMRVNITATSSSSKAQLIETVDIFQAQQRQAFEGRLSRCFNLDVTMVRADVDVLLVHLQDLQQQKLKGALDPKDEVPELSDDEKAEAIAVLKAPNLTERILDDFARCGTVGERDNKLVGYLAMTSRKMPSPIAVVVQSSSAAGKSSLMDAVLAFCPDEEKQKYSAMTGQSLYYMKRDALRHKVLAIAEEEGAARAVLSLKLVNSDGNLSIAVPTKNPTTGVTETVTYSVDGPVMIFFTTTSCDVNEELMNRCLVLSVDEDRAQTRAIHDEQRKRRTIEGLKLSTERKAVITLHQNMQRLLRPLAVVNPWAEHLTFSDERTRMRRDNAKYLSLIDVIALLHQYQRPTKTIEHQGEVVEYVEVTLDDIALANRLAAEVFGRSLDELPPQTRKMLNKLSDLVDSIANTDGVARDEVRLTRRMIFDATGWSSTVCRKHIDRLVDAELLIPHRAQNGVAFIYELVFDDKHAQGEVFSGLVSVEELQRRSTLLPKTADLAPTLPPPCSHPAPTLLPPFVDEKPRSSAEMSKRAAKGVNVAGAVVQDVIAEVGAAE